VIDSSAAMNRSRRSTGSASSTRRSALGQGLRHLERAASFVGEINSNGAHVFPRATALNQALSFQQQHNISRR
jgi:hypothetical protein